MCPAITLLQDRIDALILLLPDRTSNVNVGCCKEQINKMLVHKKSTSVDDLIVWLATKYQQDTAFDLVE